MIPYQRPHTSLLERVRQPPTSQGITFSIRFDKAKIRKIKSDLSRLPGAFEAVMGSRPALPRRIFTMTQADVRYSKKIRRDAGHGMYDRASDTVKVNPAMRASDILLNVVHEIIHAEHPWMAEREVDEKADKIYNKLRPNGGRRPKPIPLGIDATCLIEGLWIGSKPEIGRVVGESGFDLLVLCAEEYQPPAWQFPGVDVIHAPFDDNDIGPLPIEKEIARTAGSQVATALRNHSQILVTCQQGRNRSGLVCGLALVENGLDPVRVIHLIQDTRRNALTNDAFVDLIAGS